ncbi:P-loop containing nucleoside triphosphate hydrolase protein [Suillus placidus]|uniref:P-loop containing nucleoside triphosphate hydrolase protein n=1 Tax=Suillus placidus TaxID=48579 RepID=A0A9P6ZUF6_9AGAM|nr:P-loop containing nucleoside triphosphate hydrolase protein [Suillus placidus]
MKNIDKFGTTGAGQNPGSTKMQQQQQGRPRNVVVYGESGAGKSSLINLIAGRHVAHTSPDANTCTFTNTPYDITIDGQQFRLWDMAGLDGNSDSRLPAALTDSNLSAFLHGLAQEDGVHLLIYCMRGTRAMKDLRINYKIFSSALRDTGREVPIIAVVTCLEFYLPEMTKWWNDNQSQLAQYGMKFSDHACVTTLPDLPDIRQRRAQSREGVLRLILQYCVHAPPLSTDTTMDQQSFPTGFMQKLGRLVGGTR